MATTSMAAVPPLEFYRALWEGCEGFAELHLIRPNTRQSDGPDENQLWFKRWPEGASELIEIAARASGDWNVYHGVGLRSQMRGKDEDVASLGALWTDIDFKKTPEEQARKALSEFPVKPSIVVRTGGGIHVYWLLREMILTANLQAAKLILKSIAIALGGDLRACTLKQILRWPATLNIKYPDRPLVVVSWWKPELRYNLDVFDFLPAPPQTASSSVPAPAGEQRHPAPTRELPTELLNRIANLMSEIWVKGYRHDLTLRLGGMLAHFGYAEESSKQVIRAIAALARDEEAANREVDVGTTYARFMSEGPVAGAPSLEKLIGEEFPAPIQEKARKVFDLVRKSIPRQRRGGSEGGSQGQPDFAIAKVVKFDSRPARYQIVIHKGDKEYEVTCETTVFDEFKLFKRAFFEATDNKRIHISGPARNRQPTWEHLTENCPLEVKPAPQEASTKGSIEIGLDEFLDNKKENPEVGALRSFPGYTEHDVFFRLEAFKSHLKDRGVNASDREVIHVLKLSGWKDEQRRMGEKNPRLWVRSLNGYSKPAKPDLFENPKTPIYGA